MDQHLADLVSEGRISYETGVEKCHHVEDFNRLAGKVLTEAEHDRDPDVTQYSVAGPRRQDGHAARSDADPPRRLPASSRRWATRPSSIIEVKRRHRSSEIKIPGFGDEGEAEGPGRHLAAVRDDDQLGPVAAACAEHPGGPDGNQRACTRCSARSAATSRPGRRCPARCPSTQVFPPLMVNMIGPARSAASSTRSAAGCGELRDGGQAARQDQVRDDLPGRRVRHGDPDVYGACCCSSSRSSRRCSAPSVASCPLPTLILVMDVSNILKVHAPLIIVGLIVFIVRLAQDRTTSACGKSSTRSS